MHNAVRVLLLFLAVMTGWAADPPPPLVRSVLTTNLPQFGSAGQALFRTPNLPYLAWSNIIASGGDTVLSNYYQTNWGGILSNALTGKLDSNLWWTTYGQYTLTNSGSFIASHLGNGTNTTFWQSNVAIPPVVIKPVTGSQTNRLEVHDTNGSPKFVVDSMGRVGFGTNLPLAGVEISSTNQDILRVTAPLIANGTNAFCVRSNGQVVIATSPFGANYALSVGGGIYSGAALTCVAGGVIGFNGGPTWNQSGTASSYIGSCYNFAIGGAITPGRVFSVKPINTNQFDIVGYDQAGAQTFSVQSNGWTGIGTNSPQAALQVTADNSAANVAIFGTTNKPALVTIATNGVLSVNPGGGLNPVGCYGSLMMNATNIVVCAGAASVYTNVAGTGYTTIVTNGFYGSVADALTNLYAGWYRVTVSASGLGQNNQATEWEVFTNGASCDLISYKKTFDAAARMDSGAATGIIYLPASTRIDFRVQDAGTGGSISIHRASITVGTP